jgi:hypothetical protein
MWKSIRRIVGVTALVAVLGILGPAAARADDQDYNAYWRDQAETQQQEQVEAQQLQQNYNAYWQEQAEQQPQQ